MSSEKFANNSQTVLNGDISNSTTSVIVTSGSTFPTSGQFRILIDSEIMLVTSISGGVTYTVIRGVEGTSAVFHANGSLVTHVWTAGSLNQSIADCCQFGTFSSLPAAEKAGRLYFCSDTLQLFRDNGSSWVQVLVYPADLVTATDAATITFDLSAGRIQQVTLGGNRTLATTNEPPNGPFTIILEQPSSGGPDTVTWWSGILWAGGSAPTLTTTASKRDMFAFVKLSTGVYLGTTVGQNY